MFKLANRTEACNGQTTANFIPGNSRVAPSELFEDMSSVWEVQMKRGKQVLLGAAIGGLGIGVVLASRGAAPGADVSELKVTIRE
jgi:hypothetical protein